MSFQIKNFSSIVAGQINHARSVTDKITDFQPGSVARTLIEAPAVEMEELYIRMMLGLRDAIPVATFLSFGFDRLPSAYAYGWVTVTSDAPATYAISIHAGTLFYTVDNKEFRSVEDVMWQVGQSSVSVHVVAQAPGLAGNVSAGTITRSPLFGLGYTVGNSVIESGRDAENDDERMSRFAEFVRSLSRGTLSACLYAVSSAAILDERGSAAEYVTRVGFVEQLGFVRFWIYSSHGVASSDLLKVAQEILDGTVDAAGAITPGYRPAGVRMEVLAMAERAVAMQVQVGMYDGYELSAAVMQAIGDRYSSMLRAVRPGATLHLKSLVEDMLLVDGVRIIVSSSSENIDCGMSEKLVPGALTITSL